MQARHEVDQAFRVGGKVVQRKVDVGQTVREGDVLAVLDDTDYRLAEEAARQQLIAAAAQARQAESDRQRLEALKGRRLGQRVRRRARAERRADDGAAAAEAGAQARARAQPAEVHGAARLAQRRRHRRALRGRPGRRRRPAGRVDRQPRASPRSSSTCRRTTSRRSRRRGTRRGSPARRTSRSSTSCCASSRRRRPRRRAPTARAEAGDPRPLPLGATATLVVERGRRDAGGRDPGQRDHAEQGPAGGLGRSRGQRAGRNRRARARRAVHGYRNDEVLVSGPPAGELVVTAGVQKMAPGLRVALPERARATKPAKQAAR